MCIFRFNPPNCVRGAVFVCHRNDLVNLIKLNYRYIQHEDVQYNVPENINYSWFDSILVENKVSYKTMWYTLLIRGPELKLLSLY